jgi:hypothetical protein
MTALAMAGRLASCQSCVEHYYFQSQQNSVAFLDACAAGGLVEKVSLLDLRGDLGPRPFPTLRQKWYDQAIYISAPIFRKENLDAARERIDGTKNAVYNAFHLYYEVLGADDKAIGAAYVQAVKDGNLLRHPDIARERQDVDMSPVAWLRLIQDGFRNLLKNENPALSREEVEKRINGATADYVFGFSGTDIALPPVSDHAEELEEFIEEFLLERHDLKEFWLDAKDKLPVTYRTRMLLVIRELIYHRYDALHSASMERARLYVERIQERIREAQGQSNDKVYSEALSDMRDNLNMYVSGKQVPPLANLAGSTQPSAELSSY